MQNIVLELKINLNSLGKSNPLKKVLQYVGLSMGWQHNVQSIHLLVKIHTTMPHSLNNLFFFSQRHCTLLHHWSHFVLTALMSNLITWRIWLASKLELLLWAKPSSSSSKRKHLMFTSEKVWYWNSARMIKYKSVWKEFIVLWKSLVLENLNIMPTREMYRQTPIFFLTN